MTMNSKTSNMEYYDFLFPYEIIARQYGDIKSQYEKILTSETDADQRKEILDKIAEAEANARKFSNKAQVFVDKETDGRGCPPPKRPPCRWPDEPCLPEDLVCIDAQYIEKIDLVFPITDTDSYTIVIKNSATKIVVVNYTQYTNGHRFFKYHANGGLSPGEKYEFEIVIDAGIGAVTTIIYPFKITP